MARVEKRSVPLPVYMPPPDRRGTRRGQPGTGRRRFPRVPARVGCVYQSAFQRAEAHTTDLSLRGAWLPLPVPDPRGTVGSVTISLATESGSSFSFSAEVEVVRTRFQGGKSGVGLAFRELDQQALSRLGAFLLSSMGVDAFPQIRGRCPSVLG